MNPAIKLLVVQKIEDSTLSETSPKFITDKGTLRNIKSVVEDFDYEKYNQDDLSLKLENNNNYYLLSFFKNKDVNSTQQGLYAIFLFEDETIIVSDVENSQMYKNSKNDEQLIEKLKKATDIPL